MPSSVCKARKFSLEMGYLNWDRKDEDSLAGKEPCKWNIISKEESDTSGPLLVGSFLFWAGRMCRLLWGTISCAQAACSSNVFCRGPFIFLSLGHSELLQQQAETLKHAQNLEADLFTQTGTNQDHSQNIKSWSLVV